VNLKLRSEKIFPPSSLQQEGKTARRKEFFMDEKLMRWN
jgi:hypothetical protein